MVRLAISEGFDVKVPAETNKTRADPRGSSGRPNLNWQLIDDQPQEDAVPGSKRALKKTNTDEEIERMEYPGSMIFFFRRV